MDEEHVVYTYTEVTAAQERSVDEWVDYKAREWLEEGSPAIAMHGDIIEELRSYTNYDLVAVASSMLASAVTNRAVELRSEDVNNSELY